MPPMSGTFDANQFKPNYGGFDKVMPGKYPAKIVNTEIQPTKDNTGGMFVVSYQTPAGQIIQDRFNLWNASPKAVEIAHGQLSAVCHATGVFRLDWTNEGAGLRNAELIIEVGWQKGNEPTQEKPEGGYTEVKRLYDRNGNEPGKAPTQQQQAPQGNNQQWQPQGATQQLQQQQQVPMTQQPNGGWGAPQQQSQPQQQQAPQPNPGWGAAAPQGQIQQQQPTPQAGGKPPWAQ